MADPQALPALLGGANSTPALLVIDQFEELFTLCTDTNERHAFAKALLALMDGPTWCYLVLTLRTDFEPFLARYPELHAHIEAAQVRVTPLSAAELRRAIAEPAEQVGLRFEAGVVDALLQATVGEPAALPLLQFTLRALWDRRKRNRISWEAYQALGGGRQALARAADHFYDNLIPEEQVTTRRILLQLVHPGAGLEVTSNRVPVLDLLNLGEDPGRVERVLEQLLAAHLLKQSEGDAAADRQMEVAHEALIRNWPRLVEWLEEERESIRQRLQWINADDLWFGMAVIITSWPLLAGAAKRLHNMSDEPTRHPPAR